MQIRNDMIDLIAINGYPGGLPGQPPWDVLSLSLVNEEKSWFSIAVVSWGCDQ